MPLVVAVIVGLVVFGVIAALLHANEPSADRAPVGMQIRLDGPGKFAAEIVGEGNYQDELAEICGGHCDDGVKHRCEARLILEDDNVYDDQAVKVTIDGMTVGHLARPFARRYRQRLADTGYGRANAVVDAVIRGGFIRPDGELGKFGVWLDLPMTDD